MMRPLPALLMATALAAGALPSRADTGREMLKAAARMAWGGAVGLATIGHRHLTAAADGAPIEDAAVSPVTPRLDGVTVSAKVLPGSTPQDGMSVTLTYRVPADQRLCVGYVPFEAVGMPGSTTKMGTGQSERKCIDKPATGVVEDRIAVVRNDLPLVAPMQTDAQRTPEQDLMRDGYLLVNMSVGGQVLVYRVDSRYFKRDIVVMAKKGS